MDIDFPLILVTSVLVTGAVWIFDRVFLLPGRLAAAEVFLDANVDLDQESAEETVKELKREPVIVEYSVSFFPVLLLVLVLRSFLIEPFQIPTGSMIPSLMVGDFILVNKFSYGIRLPVLRTKIIDIDEPKNGDVMVFFPPHESRYFIKRVIGIPGDVIRYADKKLTINGVEASQEFVAQFPPRMPVYERYKETLGDVEHLIHRGFEYESPREWVVKDGYYFMMGDNRDNSNDSRFWGLVPQENIVGKAFAIWVHKEPGWNLPGFSRNGFIH